MPSALKSGRTDLVLFGQRLRERLEPSRGERPGRPTDPSWRVQRKLPMSESTLQILEQVAEEASSDERRVSPMQIAALLVEDAAKGLAEQLQQD
ncbi:hypothetical protein Pla175_49580 [Pirellulimonas nuda]|uniref:Uncharacterized protein n=1 Tax=Pirellulimonas nuda TaxID=2528009 RepID=A0A518DJ71_9BACT|nr:hypothetical protein Pla175_49580 [Pirellulimonas nuda]